MLHTNYHVKMLLYLDTNMYDRISKAGAAYQLRAALDARGHRVMASAVHAFEALRTKDENQRDALMRTIGRVYSDYVEMPERQRQGWELVREIRRCRPRWLGSKSEKDQKHRLERVNQEYRRQRAQLDRFARLPEDSRIRWDDTSTQEYFHMMDNPKKKSLQSRQAFRQSFEKGQVNFERIEWTISGVNPREFALEPQMWEARWRMIACHEWADTLLTRTTLTSDDRMFANPIVRREPINAEDYIRFWMQEVNGDAIPAIRLDALMMRFQTERKPARGDDWDRVHAVHLLDCNAVLTGDDDFFAVMGQVIACLPVRGVPVHVLGHANGAALDPVQAIVDALDARFPPSAAP